MTFLRVEKRSWGPLLQGAGNDAQVEVCPPRFLNSESLNCSIHSLVNRINPKDIPPSTSKQQPASHGVRPPLLSSPYDPPPPATSPLPPQPFFAIEASRRAERRGPAPFVLAVLPFFSAPQPLHSYQVSLLGAKINERACLLLLRGQFHIFTTFVSLFLVRYPNRVQRRACVLVFCPAV